VARGRTGGPSERRDGTPEDKVGLTIWFDLTAHQKERFALTTLDGLGILPTKVVMRIFLSSHNFGLTCRGGKKTLARQSLKRRRLIATDQYEDLGRLLHTSRLDN